jgi:hypothetical protein
MAPDFTSAMTILQHVEGWVKSVVGWKQSRDAHNREQTGAALKALVAATSATRQYLAAVRRDPSSQDFAKQSKLAELWGEAAFTITRVPISRSTTFPLLKALGVASLGAGKRI